MKVELIDHMGSDLDVVNAARVSFDKESKWEVDAAPNWGGQELSYKDASLIHYLAEHGHWSPFVHVMAKFRMKAPFAIARQLWKSHIGVATQDESLGWNEVSRRYVPSSPTYHLPLSWRLAAENVKQGSSDEILRGDDDELISLLYEDLVQRSKEFFDLAIKKGVCVEQARFGLLTGTETEWIWTGSLYAFARIFKQRTTSYAQKEASFIAQEIDKHMKELFPVSWEALTKNER